MIKAIDADEKNSSSTKKNIKNYCHNWVRSHCYNGKTLTSDSDLDKQIVRTKSKRFENITIKKTLPFYNAIIQCIEFAQKFLMLTITEYTYISYIYIYLSLCLSISYIIYHIYKYIYIYIYTYIIYIFYIYTSLRFHLTTQKTFTLELQKNRSKILQPHQIFSARRLPKRNVTWSIVRECPPYNVSKRKFYLCLNE